MPKTIAEIPVDQIDPAPDNPRRELRDIPELAASIADKGVLQDLLVTPRGNRYLAVIGHRRLAAATLAGLATVPCEVRELPDAERLDIMLTENLQRDDLTYLEEAAGWQARLAAEPGLSQRKLAARFGVDPSHVSRRIKLLTLPEEAKTSLDAEAITVRQAEELARLADEPATIRELLSDRARVLRQQMGRTLDGDIAGKLEHRRRRVRAEQTRAQLAKQGMEVLDAPEGGWWDSTARPLDGHDHAQCVSYRTVEVDEAEHAGLSCHVMTVCTRHGQAVPVCRDHRLHTPADGTATTPTAEELAERDQARRDAEAAKQAEEKAIKTATKARTAFMAALVRGDDLPSDHELLEALAWALVGDTHVDDARLACQLLDLPAATEEDHAYRDWRQPLQRHAAAGGEQLLQVGLAVALAKVDNKLRLNWLPWAEPIHANHFARLAQHGYPVSPVEQAKLDRDQARRRDRQAQATSAVAETAAAS